MLENLLVTLLLATYYTTTSIYCFLQLFPKRITSNAKNYFHVIVSFILIWSFFMIKAYNHSAEMTTLTQLVMFLNLSFLFKAPIKQKLLSYFIYLLGGFKLIFINAVIAVLAVMLIGFALRYATLKMSDLMYDGPRINLNENLSGTEKARAGLADVYIMPFYGFSEGLASALASNFKNKCPHNGGSSHAEKRF